MKGPDPQAAVTLDAGALQPAPLTTPLGPMQRLIRRWWVLVICIAIGIAAALIYIANTPAIYSLEAILLIQRTGPAATRSLPQAELLSSQRALLLSDAVIARADSARVSLLRRLLEVRIDKSDGTMTLDMQTDQPREYAAAINTLTDAYLKAVAEQHNGPARLLQKLTADRAAKAADRNAKEKTFEAFAATASTGADADRAFAARITQLKSAVAAAQADVARSDAAIASADASLRDPQRAAQLYAAARPSGAFTALDQQQSQIELDIAQLQPQLQKQKATLLPRHPLLQQTQTKMDQLHKKLDDLKPQYAIAYHAYLGAQKSLAEKKLAELKGLLDQQAAQTRTNSTDVARYAQLNADVKQADAALAKLDRQIHDAAASASSSISAKLVQPAIAPSRPTWPDRATFLALGALAGLLLGILFAAVPRAR